MAHRLARRLRLFIELSLARVHQRLEAVDVTAHDVQLLRQKSGARRSIPTRAANVAGSASPVDDSSSSNWTRNASGSRW